LLRPAAISVVSIFFDVIGMGSLLLAFHWRFCDSP
jgi:hypothetical protein